MMGIQKHTDGILKFKEGLRVKEEISPVEYIDEECVSCGRYRVEMYTDGRKVCEKCHYNQETNEFDVQ